MTSVEELIQTGLLGEALDKGPALVFVADEQMKYIAVNDLVAQTLGYTRAELLTMHVTDVVREPNIGARYDRFVRSGKDIGDAILTCKDGTEIAYEGCAVRTRVAGLELYVSIGFV